LEGSSALRDSVEAGVHHDDLEAVSHPWMSIPTGACLLRFVVAFRKPGMADALISLAVPATVPLAAGFRKAPRRVAAQWVTTEVQCMVTTRST
jgi:hypothetical protein